MTGRDPARDAFVAGVACYVVWGLSPLVYQPMGRAGADAWEIMGHRALWGSVWAGGLVWLTGQAGTFRTLLADWRTLRWLALSTVMIAINWALYVWAVNNGHTLETSLGYYLNPLLNMALGAWFFRERMDRLGLVAIALAVVGVLLQALALGRLPVVSLVLAVSFAIYGVIRKQVKAEALPGLFVECLIMLPFGLVFLTWLETQHAGAFFTGWDAAFWLMMCGPVTVFSLALFAWSARRLPLSTMGFLQFLAPTISFVIGVVQGEAFTPLRALSFGFIWLGAAVFAIAAWRRSRLAREVAGPA